MMALTSLPFIFVAALATSSSAHYSVNCSRDVHENCDEEFSFIMESSKPLYTWTEEDLSIYCRKFVNNVDCKQEYLEKCGDGNTDSFFGSATQGLRDLSKEICNETTDFRAAYESHIDCIRNASYLFGGCMLPSMKQTMMEVHENSGILTNVERRIKSLCRFQELFTECVTSEVEKFCGQDAANFIGTGMNRTFETVRTPLCVEGKWNGIFEILDDEAIRRMQFAENI